MAEHRIYQGHVYTRNAPGEPWVLAGRAPDSPPPAQGGVFTLPQSPSAARDDARSDAQLELERQRVIIAQQQAALAASKAGLDAQGEGTKQRTAAARGGMDTTESERTAAFLATRVAGGLQDLARVGNIGAPSLKDALVGGTLVGNYTTDEARQRTINAQRDILDAALTLGTGAAYTKEQIDAYRMSYFPQPGDGPQTIQDKTTRLNRLLEAGKLKAGAAGGLIDEALATTQTPAPGSAGSQGETVLYSPEPADGLRGSVTDTSPNTPAPAGSFSDSYLGQGMSGLNEGIGNTLGLPVDLTTAAMNLVPKGINAIANTQIPEIKNPFGGSEYINNLLKDMGAIRPVTEDPSKQFLRRTAQSVGGAMVPLAGIEAGGANVAKSLLSSAAGGAGAATAQQVFPGNPVAEMGGEMLGSGLSVAGLLARNRSLAQRGIEDAIPTVDQLKSQAGDLYRQAEARGVTADPMLTQQLADDMRQTLRSEGHISPTGRISEVYPKTREAMQLVEDYAGSPMNPTQMQTVRKVIADGAQSADRSEKRVSRLLMQDFDNWASPLAPELEQARSVAGRYLTAEELERARELAGARAGQFTGSGFENALRTEYRGLDRNSVKGRLNFPPEVQDAIETVSRGTPASNVARALGRFAPRGPVSFGLGTGGPAAVGAMIGGPVGAATTGGAALALGEAGRYAATRMGIRNADIAEMIARNGGPIDQAPLLTPEMERIVAALAAGQGSQYLEKSPNP